MGGAKQPVEQGEEDVVARIRAVVVPQMESSGRLKEPRQPFAQVDSPMQLFDRHEIHGEREEHSGGNSQAEDTVNRRYGKTVHDKHQDDPQRGFAEGEVLRFIRSARGAVVDEVTTSKKTSRQVKDEAMINVFKAIRPNQTRKQAEYHPFEGGRK